MIGGQGLALSNIKIDCKPALFKVVSHKNILESRNRPTHGTIV